MRSASSQTSQPPSRLQDLPSQPCCLWLSRCGSAADLPEPSLLPGRLQRRVCETDSDSHMLVRPSLAFAASHELRYQLRLHL